MAKDSKTPSALRGGASDPTGRLLRFQRRAAFASDSKQQRLMRQADRTYALDQVEALSQSIKVDALADLTERKMQSRLKKISSEEKTIKEALALAYNIGSEELQTAVESYYRSLSERYWESTQIEVTFGPEGAKLIKNKFIPIIDNLINEIQEDTTFDTERKKKLFQQPLLEYANKIKFLLEDRLSLVERLQDSVESLAENSDVVMGVLAGASSGSALAGLAAFALSRSSRKTNTFASKFAVTSERLRSKRNRLTRQVGDVTEKIEQKKEKNPTPEPPVPPVPPIVTDTSFKGLLGPDGGYVIPPSGSPLNPMVDAVGGFARNSIEKILLRHTDLLEKIYDVLNDSLKAQQKHLESQLIANEEARLERSNIKPTDIKPTATKDNTLKNNSLFGDGNSSGISPWLPMLGRAGSVVAPALVAPLIYSAISNDPNFGGPKNLGRRILEPVGDATNNPNLPTQLAGPENDISIRERTAINVAKEFGPTARAAARVPGWWDKMVKGSRTVGFTAPTAPRSVANWLVESRLGRMGRRWSRSATPYIESAARSPMSKYLGRGMAFLSGVNTLLEGAETYHAAKEYKKAVEKKGAWSPEAWLRASSASTHALAAVPPEMAAAAGGAIGAFAGGVGAGPGAAIGGATPFASSFAAMGIDALIDKLYGKKSTPKENEKSNTSNLEFNAEKAGDFSSREGRGAYIQQQLLSAGYSAEQTQGIMANLQSENYEFDPKTQGDNGNSIGIAQWNRSRKDKVLAYQQSRSDVHPLQAQTEFLVDELAQYGLSPSELSTSANEAAQDVLFKFERPSAKFAQQRSAQYAQKFGTPTSTPAPAPSMSMSTPASSTPEQQGRSEITNEISNKSMSGNTNENAISYFVNLINSNQIGGGGSFSQHIPAPIDREPTIRRILDGALA